MVAPLLAAGYKIPSKVVCYSTPSADRVAQVKLPSQLCFDVGRRCGRSEEPGLLEAKILAEKEMLERQKEQKENGDMAN
jgi:hypothetical protein